MNMDSLLSQGKYTNFSEGKRVHDPMKDLNKNNRVLECYNQKIVVYK